jgi:hypothetical protein
MIHRAVAHGDLVHPVHTGQCTTQSASHIAAHGEQPSGCLIIQLGEVVGMWLPHHDRVARHARIGREYDADVFLVADQVLRAEHVSFGQLPTLVADALPGQSGNPLADRRPTLRPLSPFRSGGFCAWHVLVRSGEQVGRHDQTIPHEAGTWTPSCAVRIEASLDWVRRTYADAVRSRGSVG